MSDNAFRFGRWLDFPTPWVLGFGWPEPMQLSEESIRAAVFAGEPLKDAIVLLVREDQRFLGLEKLSGAWRITSGEFVGDRSVNDSMIVRATAVGVPIPPKKGLLRFLRGNNGAECTGREAIATALHFTNRGALPADLAWWGKTEKSERRI